MSSGYTTLKPLWKIKELGSDLSLEEHITTDCPFCGASHEKSFNIRRVAAGYLYICHRATCGKSGFIGDTQPANTRRDNIQNKTRAFTGFLMELPGNLYENMYALYQIPFSVVRHQGIRYAPDIDRIYIPIYDYRGYQIGELLRSVDKERKPKVLLNKWALTPPCVHFPLMQPPADTCVLVEDYLSAIKISLADPSIISCALLGTHISDEIISYLKQIGVSNVIIMLDGNVWRVITGHVSRLKGIFNCQGVYLDKDKDPKDLSLEQLKEIINE